MLSDYFTVNTIFECCCCVVALICVGNDKAIAWRAMALFMVVTCIGEWAGVHVRKHSLQGGNHVIYNSLLPLQIAFYHIMYFYLLAPFKKYRIMLLIGIVALALLYTHDIIKFGFSLFSMDTYALLAVLNIVYGLTYYYLRLKDDENDENLLHSAAFWWVAGILFFSFGSSMSNLFDTQLDKMIWKGHHLTFYIFRGLNIILYTTWSFAFYCRRWKKQI